MGEASEIDESDDDLLNQRSWEKSQAEDVVSFAELLEAKPFELKFVDEEVLTKDEAGQLQRKSILLHFSCKIGVRL